VGAALGLAKPKESVDGARFFMPQCVHVANAAVSLAAATDGGRHVQLPGITPRPILHHTGEIFNRERFDRHGWKFVGKIFDNCSLFESETGIVVLNLRVAVRKILFERLRHNPESKEQQSLLIPIDIATTDAESRSIGALSNFLMKKNVEIYQFGKNCYRISSIPTWLSPNQVESFVRAILRASVECNFDETVDSVDENFAKIASQHARCEQYTTGDDISALVDKLLQCDNSQRGPSGEATFFEIPKCDFLKRFPFL
jgi:DNA mismatch repair ATPase MutL